MNVKQLKEVLAELPDEMLVMLSSDSEGNGYSVLYGTGLAWFQSKHGDVYNLDEDPEYFDQEECEKVIVFWP